MVLKISLPEGVQCLVKEGTLADFSLPLYEIKKESQIHVHVAKSLRIPSDKIFLYLKKLVGDKIDKGEMLASKKGFFSGSAISSPQKGTIREINHDTGDVILNVEGEDKKIINCYFKGKIKKIMKNELELEIPKITEFAVKSSSRDFGAQTFYLDKEYPHLSTTDVSGKTIVAETLSSFFQTKLEALGVTGFVTINKLPENTNINYCQIKNIADLEKIKKLKLTYCLIDKKNSRIIFYD